MQELAAMLLSRQDKELSQNQKYVLGTLFGETTVMHTLRSSLVRSELQSEKLRL